MVIYLFGKDTNFWRISNSATNNQFSFTKATIECRGVAAIATASLLLQQWWCLWLTPQVFYIVSWVFWGPVWFFLFGIKRSPLTFAMFHDARRMARQSLCSEYLNLSTVPSISMAYNRGFGLFTININIFVRNLTLHHFLLSLWHRTIAFQ